MTHCRLLIVLIVVISISSASAQTDSSRSGEAAQMTLKLKNKRAPMGALLRSVAVPGWGQYYNRKYIKSGVVLIAESFFIYEAARWWGKAEDQYDKVLTTTGGDQFFQFQLYQSYRGTRDDYLWLVGVSVFLSMFDAYVDAHLSGFDVDLTPDFEDRRVPLKLTAAWRF